MIGGKTDPESFGSCFRGDEEADGILMGRSEGLIYTLKGMVERKPYTSPIRANF